jgi:hypothetical protein
MGLEVLRPGNEALKRTAGGGEAPSEEPQEGRGRETGHRSGWGESSERESRRCRAGGAPQRKAGSGASRLPEPPSDDGSRRVAGSGEHRSG